MLLNYQKLGSGHPLIILHGLYGNGGNWLSIGKSLAGISEVILVDQRNHGLSPHSEIMDYQTLASDLKDLMDRLGIGKAAILGHSMGGKAAMWFATENPGRVSHLIVADISPRSYVGDTGSSNNTSEHEVILSALKNTDLNSAHSIGEVDRQLEQGIPAKRLRQFLLKNLGKDAAGRYFWRINVDAIAQNIRGLTDGLDTRILDQKSFRQFPTLFVKGERSPYIREEDVRVIRSLFPLAQIITIKNAGHWLHAEEPELFTGIVKNFLIG